LVTQVPVLEEIPTISSDVAAASPVTKSLTAPVATSPVIAASPAAGLAQPLAVSAAAPAPGVVNQCNGTDNVGGQAVACDVTVVNTSTSSPERPVPPSR
jgi:hypothetical protein